MNGRPGPVLRTGSSLMSLSWHPDGKRLAVGLYSGQIQFWSKDGKLPSVLEGHRSADSGNMPVWGVAWSPDGRLLASASADRTVRLWQLDGTAGPVFEGHSSGLRCVSWSPDGTQLVSGAFDGEIRVWNIDGTPGPLLKGHNRGVRDVAWSPDGTRIVSGCDEGTVRIWSSDGTGDPVVLRPDGSPVYSLAWSPDGEQIVETRQATMNLWSKTGERGALVRGQRVSLAAYPVTPQLRRTRLGFFREKQLGSGLPTELLHAFFPACQMFHVP